MMGNSNREVFEDFAIIAGLIGVQLVYAGNSVLQSYLMSLGMHSLIILSTFSILLVLSPPSFYFERSKWPNKLTLKLWTKLVLISVGGVTLFQSLFLKGIELASPAVATAMPNLAPGLIFVIAWAFRLEEVKPGCVYSKIKTVGTLLYVIGAVTMSIMHCTVPTTLVREAQISASRDNSITDERKIFGCIYLIAAVFVLSSNVVLQAATLGDFPAPMSLCAITSLIGLIITVIVQLIQEHKLETGWPVLSIPELIGYSLMAGTVSGVCVSFNGWAMKKRGPVLISLFNPVGTVISIILSLVTLGQSVNLGTLGGMFLMFIGLYLVLWAKGKECTSRGGRVAVERESDVEKPLLS